MYSLRNNLAALMMAVVVVVASMQLAQVQCEVDSSRPDLSIFKLRHVDSRRFSRHKVDDPIGDYATGAQLMHESLFSDDFQVRCLAHGHLLKLLADHTDSGLPSPRRPIKLDLVEALALVANIDRPLYYDLFFQYKHDQLGGLFASAVEQLEARFASSNVARDAWLELIKCMSTYFEPELAGLLSGSPRRAKQLANYKLFKSLPIDQVEWEARGKLGSHVKQVKHKFEASTGATRLDKLPVSGADLVVAWTLVESYDNNELAQLRARIKADLATGSRKPAAAAAGKAHEEVEPVGQEDEDEAKPFTDDDDDEAGTNLIAGADIQMTIEVPDDQVQPAAAAGGQAAAEALVGADKEEAIRARISALTFIMFRLAVNDMSLGPRGGRPAGLPISLALDFKNHWQDLEATRDSLPGDSATARELRDYLADADHRLVYDKVSQAVQVYGRTVEKLLEIDSREAARGYKSMEELEADYRQLFKLIGQLDGSFEVRDLGRAIELDKRQKLRQFQVLNKFIESEGLW